MTSTAGKFIGLIVLALASLSVAGCLLTTRFLALRDLQAAESWVATPCVMEKCEFVSVGDGGRELDIRYRYRFEGREYRGDRLDLLIGTMGDDDVMEEFVFETYPSGVPATCYVDPDDPANSVFDRDHAAKAPPRLWLLAFPFMCMALGFTFLVVRAVVRSREQLDAGYAPVPSIQAIELGPPPRKIPWLTQATVLAGPPATQTAWMFVVGFVFVFVLMDGPASYARLFNLSSSDEQTTGRIKDVRPLDQQELSETVYQYTFDYEVNGQTYTADSCTRGQRFNEGDKVTVIYDPANPADGTIAGTRASEFTWWHSAIPLGIVLLLVLGLTLMYNHSFRTLRLLKHGQVIRARRRDSGASADEATVQADTIESDFEIEVDGRSYRANKYNPSTQYRRRLKPDDTPGADELVVLYDVNRPDRNIIFGGVLGALLDDRHTIADQILHCTPGPLAVAALLILLSGVT